MLIRAGLRGLLSTAIAPIAQVIDDAPTPAVQLDTYLKAVPASADK